MRSKRLMRCLAVLAALTLTFWLVSPTSAETGCHKTKGKGGSDTKAVQTVS